MFLSEARRKRSPLLVDVRLHEELAEATRAAVDHERQRIARDLHDGVAQQIAYVLHKLELIQYQIGEQQMQLALSELRHTYGVLKASLQDLRDGIAALLPAQLAQQGLRAALESLISDYKYNHPEVELSWNSAELRNIPTVLEVPIFRMIQEALTNSSKHAHARRVSLTISRPTSMLIVEVSDNGVGFRPAGAESGRDYTWHLGLRAMRERIQEAGGWLEVQSQLGEGTTVRARFPLEHALAFLTKRERTVLLLVADGLTNRSIAAQLAISEKTVKVHVHHIIQKMRVRDRTQAAVVALRYGLLET